MPANIRCYTDAIHTIILTCRYTQLTGVSTVKIVYLE